MVPRFVKFEAFPRSRSSSALAQSRKRGREIKNAEEDDDSRRDGVAVVERSSFFLILVEKREVCGVFLIFQRSDAFTHAKCTRLG